MKIRGIKENEHIACSNATVIADENDNMVGWINNDGGVMHMIVKENDDEPMEQS